MSLIILMINSLDNICINKHEDLLRNYCKKKTLKLMSDILT